MSRASAECSGNDRFGARCRRLLGALVLCVAALGAAVPAASAQPGSKIILIGGPTKASYTPGAHDFPRSIQFLDELLRETPQISQLGLIVQAHPYEWPQAQAFEGAATLVFNFSGVGRHPLLDPAKRNIVAKLVDSGVGLVALHQTFTLPEHDTSVPLQEWLGGARYGMQDRTTMPARMLVTAEAHPVARGLKTFIHRDEFYPTIRFKPGSGKLTPIWSADLPIQVVRGEPVAGTQVNRYAVAWAYERANGGRSFAFSGAHFLEDMDSEQARKLLLNAIVWTAGRSVPAGGVTTTAQPGIAAKLLSASRGRKPVTTAVVVRPKDYQVIEMPWGRLTWHTSGELGNTDHLTTGIATILPGKSNPIHHHPNCDEVLHVLKGRIRHSMNGTTVVMNAGDTISIPQGVRHNAENISDEPAELAISFSTAWREAIGE